MPRTPARSTTCPIARGLEHVGEWWNILILRDAFAGLTRFDEFQKSLGIAPTMLTRRLAGLVESGLLERHRYSDHPPRDEYRLTAMGADFHPVLIAMLAWGNRHFAPAAGPSIQIVDRLTGAPAEPLMVDRATGRPLAAPAFAVVPGPGATEAGRQRLARGRGRLLPNTPHGDAA